MSDESESFANSGIYKKKASKNYAKQEKLFNQEANDDSNESS